MFRQKHTVLKLFAGIAAILLLSSCEATTKREGTRESHVPTASSPSVLTEIDAANSYKAFLQSSDSIFADGGLSPERISEFARGDALDDFIADAKDLQSRGWHLVGSTQFDSIAIQASSPSEISFYVCDDVSQTDLLDDVGNSLVEPDRVSRSPWAVVASTSDGVLKVASKDLWVGENFCL